MSHLAMAYNGNFVVAAAHLKFQGTKNKYPEIRGHTEKTLLEKAGHVRTVMGCNSLPLGVAVEIAAIAALE